MEKVDGSEKAKLKKGKGGGGVCLLRDLLGKADGKLRGTSSSPGGQSQGSARGEGVILARSPTLRLISHVKTRTWRKRSRGEHGGAKKWLG